MAFWNWLSLEISRRHAIRQARHEDRRTQEKVGVEDVVVRSLGKETINASTANHLLANLVVLLAFARLSGQGLF